MKQCSRCQLWKPETDFYPQGKGRRMAMCKDCDRARVKPKTTAKLLRTRARNRATVELVRRHRDEFDHLVSYFGEAVWTEHELLEETERASHDGQAPRLLPGKRREEQTVLDRIRDVYAEVGRCTDCSSHHKHDHACPSCGAAPGEHAAPLPDDRGSCTCVHPARRHDVEDGCLVSDCECAGVPIEAAS